MEVSVFWNEEIFNIFTPKLTFNETQIHILFAIVLSVFK